MTNLSRRAFLTGATTLAVAASLPAVTLSALPRIVGNGIHDDWAGLQAAIDGKPFLCDDAMMVATNGYFRIDGGHFRITKTLHFGRDAMGTITNSIFDAFNLEAGTPAFYFDRASVCYVGQNHINTVREIAS